MRSKYRMVAMVMAVGCAWAMEEMPVWAAAAGTPSALTGAESGAQLSRLREYLERERVAKEIAEAKAKKHTKVENKTEEAGKEAVSAVKFKVNGFNIPDSKVLTAEEVAKITTPYIGKEVELKSLYEVVGQINKLYEDKGYITCRAMLPPQTIKKGMVTIRLVEGTTGTVSVEGNKSTRTGYIKDRIDIQPGKVKNIKELNKDLLLFNAANDVQLRISMKAGTEPGTTDYEIKAYEPQRQIWTVYEDNAGSESTGQWRTGLFYNNRSLRGVRDNLSIGTLDSVGNKSFFANYSTPLGRSGTKLAVQYSTNSIKITHGEMEPLRVRGHAYAANVGLTQPLVVTDNFRSEAGLTFNKQHSRTDFSGIRWLDDDLKDWTASYAATNYGDSFVLYHKYSYTYGNYQKPEIDIADYVSPSEDKNYGVYAFNGLYQKSYKHRQMIGVRLDLQYSATSYLPSARQFYIGGANSVRGYKESVLSGDKGFFLSCQYDIPVFNKSTNAFVFYDLGGVYGDSSTDTHTLSGTGFGIKTTFKNKIFASLTLGMPLKREYNGTDAGSVRLHFLLSGQF
ncbi:MAG: BamA/TamA family outer membrane protein [Acidaminococcaceae bacterium]|nr:BamA/TamA family outer membrane protein [Acidaminococcaceae bacterium]